MVFELEEVFTPMEVASDFITRREGDVSLLNYQSHGKEYTVPCAMCHAKWIHDVIYQIQKVSDGKRYSRMITTIYKNCKV